MFLLFEQFFSFGEDESICFFLPSGYCSTESDSALVLWNKRVQGLKQNNLKGSLFGEKKVGQKSLASKNRIFGSYLLLLYILGLFLSMVLCCQSAILALDMIKMS